MATCSLDNCDYECFENEDKCILHCDKYEYNNWYIVNEKNEKEWKKSKVNFFWLSIQKNLNNDYINYQLDSHLVDDKYSLVYVVFPKFQEDIAYFSPAMNEDELGTNFYSYDIFEHHNQQQPMPEVNTFFNKREIIFEECIFLDIANFKRYNLNEQIIFNKCKFENKVILNNIYESKVSFLECDIYELNCSNIVFKQKVEIKECTLYNSSFVNTNFKNISVFTESIFRENVNFKYTTFSKLVLFRKTIFENTLDLEDSVIKEESNFLGMNANMANRETARIIKHSFEKQNNIIEANKFYSLEMRERRKELDAKSSFTEWIVFFLHGLSSNHSQSWFEALFWIITLGTLYTFEVNNIPLMTLFITVITIYIMIEYFLKKHIILIKYLDKIFPILFMILIYYIIYINMDSWFKFLAMSIVDEIANNINIFSGLDPAKMTFGDYIYKISMSYLIYQFIVSVRQDTRRK